LVELLDAPRNPWSQSAFPIAPELLPLGRLRREGAVDLAALLLDDAASLLPAWREETRASIVETGTYSSIRNGVPYPTGFEDPNDPRWTVGEQFVKDVRRGGVFVDGLHAHDENAFLELMPDRRTAAQVSRVLHQGLGNNILMAFGSRELRDLTNAAIWNSIVSSTPQRGSATSLGGGAYRITYEFGKHVRDMSDVTPSPGKPAFTDYRGAVSFTIQTGPEFTIRDVDVDATVFML